MSYLQYPRLVFSGDFLADVSTVNNYTANFDNDYFANPAGQLEKGWNPEGGAVFNFQDCFVQQVTYLDGSTATTPQADSLIGQKIAGASGRASGKLVDLDPSQQMVSQLWGVCLRLLTQDGVLLLQGDIEPAAFRDLQQRPIPNVKGVQQLGVTWTSRLKNVVWGEKAIEYRFFQEIRSQTDGNYLSLNMNVFAYLMDSTQARFGLGRMFGTIGTWKAEQPVFFAPHRRLYGTSNISQAVFAISNFAVDAQRRTLSLDLGASFPVKDLFGSVDYTDPLYLAVSNKPLTNRPATRKKILTTADFTIIAPVNYQTQDWLTRTGGLVHIENLSDSILQLLANNQLILLSATAEGYVLQAREAINGFSIRPDQLVYRLDTGNQASIQIYGYQWGQPLSNTIVKLALPPVLQASSSTQLSSTNASEPITPPGEPPINTPTDGLTFPKSSTLQQGKTALSLTGNRIDAPRVYIDGQIYIIAVTGASADSAAPDEQISVHLRSYFQVPAVPVWSDIAPFMTQYSNLYLIMSKYLVDLKDPNALIARKNILMFAFTRDINDPTYMPVTRDLSENKRLTILKWLENPIIDTPKAKIPTLEAPQTVMTATKPVKLSRKQQNYALLTQMKTGKRPTQK
jgi:hypothetical protein